MTDRAEVAAQKIREAELIAKTRKRNYKEAVKRAAKGKRNA